MYTHLFSFFRAASLGLSDPMDWFRSYYKQGEHSVQSLLQIRYCHQKCTFICRRKNNFSSQTSVRPSLPATGNGLTVRRFICTFISCFSLVSCFTFCQLRISSLFFRGKNLEKIAAKAILLYLSVIFKVFEKVNNANIVMLDDLARESAREFNLWVIMSSVMELFAGCRAMHVVDSVESLKKLACESYV